MYYDYIFLPIADACNVFVKGQLLDSAFPRQLQPISPFFANQSTIKNSGDRAQATDDDLAGGDQLGRNNPWDWEEDEEIDDEVFTGLNDTVQSEALHLSDTDTDMPDASGSSTPRTQRSRSQRQQSRARGATSSAMEDELRGLGIRSNRGRRGMAKILISYENILLGNSIL